MIIAVAVGLGAGRTRPRERHAPCGHPGSAATSVRGNGGGACPALPCARHDRRPRSDRPARQCAHARARPALREFPRGGRHPAAARVRDRPRGVRHCARSPASPVGRSIVTRSAWAGTTTVSQRSPAAAAMAAASSAPDGGSHQPPRPRQMGAAGPRPHRVPWPRGGPTPIRHRDAPGIGPPVDRQPPQDGRRPRVGQPAPRAMSIDGKRPRERMRYLLSCARHSRILAKNGHLGRHAAAGRIRGPRERGDHMARQRDRSCRMAGRTA